MWTTKESSIPTRWPRRCNGYFLKDVTLKDPTGKDVTFKKGDLVPTFGFLQADGSTSCGNWLYCASYTNAGNMMARRGKEDPTGLGLYPNWAWCWPVNRRVLYNRASCDPSGQPVESQTGRCSSGKAANGSAMSLTDRGLL